MTETKPEEISRREKVDAFLDVVRYNPKFATLIVVLGLLAAVLEGVGLTFIVPIIEIVQAEDPTAEAEGVMAVFVTGYQALGLPLTLGYVVLGVAAVMTLRYTTGFLVSWFREMLREQYLRHLQLRAFDTALEARMEYFDKEGSDEIMNAIVTETKYSAAVIKQFVRLLDPAFLTLVYLAISFWIAPYLTLLSLVILGGLTVLLRGVVEDGYDLGDRVAGANEQRHTAAQAGLLGIRDIRAFGLRDEIYGNFADAVEQYTTTRIKLRRNEAAIHKFYNLSVALFVFVLIYLAIMFSNLSLGELGLFLFAMFQLGPQMSKLNKQYYELENNLPHLVRTQRFIEELTEQTEPVEKSREVPSAVETVEFDDVSFSYSDDEVVLRGIDFKISKGEFVGFVGQSGVGKSTIVSLLTRYYEPDSGGIRANDVPIDEMHPDEWRERIAIVRQSPYIFNSTLRYNLTIGNREATQHEIQRACEIARVDEFLDDLPDGYDSQLGDEGVRLSGGQKQRVALARALLKDADVLILDEATSDLDSNLEQEVQRAIESMDRDYIIITIAHRLSTVENADHIYTMVDGRVSERGKHSELVDNGGTYAQLYAIQTNR